MVTRKQKEIEELLRREISNIILREMNDPRVGFVTVTRVKVGGDYRTAKVYVTVRGEEQEIEQSLDVLMHARGRIQALIAERIKMRNTPVLTFVEDTELEQALRVDRLIDEVMKEKSEQAQETQQDRQDRPGQ